jgi:lysophospholipase L1-like esterase/regulation of enolase protein 1 (concanavalin A-like superfamily)
MKMPDTSRDRERRRNAPARSGLPRTLATEPGIRKIIQLLAACAVFLLGVSSAFAQIKVACVGDSITAGLGIADPGTQSYPAQLQALLGSGYTVQNYGDSGRTLMKNTGYSYWDSWAYTSSMSSSPDIVVIMLGTNDTKAWNWSPTNFSTDYNALIAGYKGLASHPKVYICLAPPAYTNTMNFDPAFIQNNLLPAIQGVATSNGLTLIDNNTPLLNHEELFSDGVHPTAQGASVIASTVADALTSGQGPRLQSTGSMAPVPGAGDISQLSTSGNTTWPDGLNYFTDNNPLAGQTFTTGSTPTNLVSLSLKTAGLNSGGGYGTPASTPTYYLRIYSINGGTATLLLSVNSPNPGFTDGAWLRWSGLKVPLEANKTYAFSFGIKPANGGWAALAVAQNAYAGGEIAMIPINGGAITTGTSHSYDAVFALDLQARPAAIPQNTPLPTPTYGFNLGNSLEATWGYSIPSQAVYVSAANAGFNAVRIPCAWGENSNKTTAPYQINPAYMAQVKQAVDWALAAGLYVVINDHWDGGWLENNIGTSVDPVINAKMQSYWTQIATTFAGYDNRLLFAGANEPAAHSPAEMETLKAYYQTFINAVRSVGGGNSNRWLVLQGSTDPAWFTTLPSDSTPGRLMMEYHNYTPYDFTQVNNTTSNAYYWGPAYYNPGDTSHNVTWGLEGVIDSGFQQLTDLYVSKGIPVLIGEFQAAAKGFLTGTASTYNRASALYWNKYLVDSAHGHGLSPFYWSSPNSPFDYVTGELTAPDVVDVLTGGIAPPPPNGAPYAATGLTATASGTQVTLSWNAAAGATSYRLYRASASGFESEIAPAVTGITGTTYTDTGLNGGTTYYYQVVAVNASGPSGFSPEAHATTAGINPDPTPFHFETDPQRWNSNGAQISGVATSTAQKYAGNRSLAVNFNGTTAGTSSVQVSNVNVPSGGTVTFRVWVPAGSPITVVEPYSQDFNWAWNASWYGGLSANTWNTLTLTIPSNHTTPLSLLGLRFTTNAAWTGTCYIDSVKWAPAVPAGLSATMVSASQINLGWSAVSGATSYNVKRATTSGGPYATVQSGVTGTSFNNTGLNASTTYYYVVSAVSAGGESANSAQASATTSANLGPLPAGWSEGDLGSVAASGSSGYSNGVYTVNGSGADIWGSADGAYFVRQQITGDCDIRARVVSLSNTHVAAKAGVMIRESLNANSAHALVNVTPSAGAEFIRRTTTGGASTATGNAGIAAPHWVRLVRSGNTFTAYRSADGVTWATIGSDTIAMGATVYAGLVVTSHNDGTLATATVGNVSLTALPSPWQTSDIGAVGAAGSATQTNGTFTVTGSGADIWDNVDEFRYVYQTASGDCEMVARVTAVGNTNAWAKAGVMIRESLNANSSHAMVVVPPGNGVSFQRRGSTGGGSSDTSNSGLNAPYWVRIVRSGNTFTAYRSSDGTNWTTIGSQAITMSTTVYIGLAVTSHADGTLCTATLDNVTATP